MLLLKKFNNEDVVIKSHYVLITNFSKLMYSQTNAHRKMYYCRRCLQHFTTQVKLDNHIINCNKINVQKTIFPSKDNKIVSFKNYRYKIPVPFVVYADFEALNVPIQEEKQEEKNKSTEKLTSHKICSYSYKLVCRVNDRFSKTIKIYRGENVAKHFIEAMLKEEIYCNKIINENFNKKIIMTKEDEENFKASQECHICNKKYEKDYKNKVRDHDHRSGKYMGSAHKECNTTFYYKRKLCVFFHNLKGYDSHFLIQEIGKFDMKMSFLPNNTEKFISFSIGNVYFKDSLQFLSESLDNLTKNLVKKEISTNNSNVFKYLSNQFKDEKLQLLKRKGIFPYDYLDSFDRFNEDKLPNKEAFYNRLQNTNISDEDYKHAQNVWNTFNMKTFGDYHDLYLKTDVLLLADIFENFRKLCLDYYKLDPVHYYGTPGIAWDALLKMTRQILELIRDPDIHLFLEREKKGGMSFAAHRYAKANNKYMANFDPTKESSYLMYFDANSLYS